jgi:hypothetical protein
MKEDEVGEICSMEDMRNVCKILVGKLERKRPLWKS